MHLLDALIAVSGEISESARTYFNEYLQCADFTFPNFKAITSRRIHGIRGMDFEHESSEFLERKRRVAPWCDRMDREPKKMPENRLQEVAKGPRQSFVMYLVLTHLLNRGAAIKACLLTQSF